MNRAFTNILSSNVDSAASFYENFLGMSRNFNSDWFVLLTHPECPSFEFGILDRNHATVPPEIAKLPQGVIVTFVVDDVETIFAKAKELGVEILQPPTDTPYGQRRLLMKDMDGTTIDVSSPTAR